MVRIAWRRVQSINLVGRRLRPCGREFIARHATVELLSGKVRLPTKVEEEGARLYALLQRSVDTEIQQTGFVPPEGYGMNGSKSENNGHDQNGWQCSDKREFIERIVREHNLDKAEVEALAVELHGHGVKSLNRLAASGFIDELLERHGGRKRGGQRGRQQGNGNGSSRQSSRPHLGAFYTAAYSDGFGLPVEHLAAVPTEVFLQVHLRDSEEAQRRASYWQP